MSEMERHEVEQSLPPGPVNDDPELVPVNGVALLFLAPPPGALDVLEREALELERLEDEELALLARAVGDHLPIEERMRLEAVCRRRRARTG